MVMDRMVLQCSSPPGRSWENVRAPFSESSLISPTISLKASFFSPVMVGVSSSGLRCQISRLRDFRGFTLGGLRRRAALWLSSALLLWQLLLLWQQQLLFWGFRHFPNLLCIFWSTFTSSESNEFSLYNHSKLIKWSQISFFFSWKLSVLYGLSGQSSGISSESYSFRILVSKYLSSITLNYLIHFTDRWTLLYLYSVN